MSNQNQTNQTDTENAAESNSGQQSWNFSLLKGALGLFVVVMAVGFTFYWLSNEPRARKSEKDRTSAPLVKTKRFRKRNHQVTVTGMGNVRSSEQVELVSRVSGDIVHLDTRLVPGKEIESGTELARIEQVDYKIALKQARQAVEQARHRVQEQKLSIKQANQSVAEAKQNLQEQRARRDLARQEYELLTEDQEILPSALNKQAISKEDRKLILRTYQLESARAQLQAAKASKKQAKVAYQNEKAALKAERARLDQARLDLERTRIKAPFDGVITEKHVGKGTNVSRGDPIVTLVRTDHYWVDLTLPVNKLKWINQPQTNDGDVVTPVKITFDSGWEKGEFRSGQIKEIRPGIEEQGRMARVLIEVDDPRSLQKENKGKPILLLNTLVQAKIEGRKLQDAVRIPRNALREKNQVWLVNGNGKLEIRDVEVAVESSEHVYISEGLDNDNEIITSDLATPVDGMNVDSENEKTD